MKQNAQLSLASSYILISVTAILLLSCQRQPREIANDHKNERVVTASVAENKAATLRLFEHFNNHDVEALAALYSDDAVLISPDFEEQRIGREGVRTTYGALFEDFPSVRDEVKSIVAEGNSVAIEFTSYLGIADHKDDDVSINIATFLTFEGGQIVRDTTYFDVR